MQTDTKITHGKGANKLSGLSDLQAECCRMAVGARRRILIYDWQLNRLLFEQPCMVEAFKHLAIRHAHTHVRILLADTEQLRVYGHRVLSLARRLPSAIEIRLRAELFSEDLRSFMVVDEASYIHYSVWYELNDAIAEVGNRYRVRGLVADFNSVWEQSAVDPELRQLDI